MTDNILPESAEPRVSPACNSEVRSATQALYHFTCPWYQGTGICDMGCQVEPACDVGEPQGGWLVLALSHIVAALNEEGHPENRPSPEQLIELIRFAVEELKPYTHVENTTSLYDIAARAELMHLTRSLGWFEKRIAEPPKKGE